MPACQSPSVVFTAAQQTRLWRETELAADRKRMEENLLKIVEHFHRYNSAALP